MKSANGSTRSKSRHKYTYALFYIAITIAFILFIYPLIIMPFHTVSDAEAVMQPSLTSTPLITITPSYTTAITSVLYPFEKNDFVHLAWFSKPPEEVFVPILAEQFDFFILTHKDETERDKLREFGVGKPFLEYLLLLEIQDPGDCDLEPYGNQVAYQTGDFCRIFREHPDWFLRDISGNLIYISEKSVAMDPGSSGYREFWVKRAIEMQSQYGWDGLFIDNIEGSLKKILGNASLPAKYRNDKEYRYAIEEFLSYIRGHISSQLIGNIVSTDKPAVWHQYSNHLDGFMIEKFAVDWSDGNLAVDEWLGQINLIEDALHSGKTVILVAQGRQADVKRQQFAFVSYLLVNNGNAAFRYASSDDYRSVWLYPNYDMDLGLPLGPRYRINKEWRRDFENGYIMIDPVRHTSEIRINP